MTQLRTGTKQRRGGIAPLTAVLLLPLFGMMAFSVDIGWIALCRAELQCAADASALAGAEKMQDFYVMYYAPGTTPGQSNNQTPFQADVLAAMTSPSTPYPSTVPPGGKWPDGPIQAAQYVASQNKAGGVGVTVPAGDISFSSIDENYNPPASAYAVPNSVTVTTKRASGTNGSLPLFFAQIFGWNTIELKATSRATVYAGNMTSIIKIPGVGAHILPVALDFNTWVEYYKSGKSPDGNVHTNPSGSSANTLNNGMPDLQVYPVPDNAPGSFGLVATGPPSNSSPAFRNWIDNGETPNDIDYLVSNNLVPVSLPTGQYGAKNWPVGPGMTSTLSTDFASELGKANLIPLFLPASTNPYQAAASQGNNAYYQIIGFVSVQISYSLGTGNNLYLDIQPRGIVDPTAVITDAKPVSGREDQFNSGMTSFIPAKLTN